MNKLMKGLFILWSAVCMALFVGLIVVALMYSPDALFTLDTFLMSSTMLFSSISFYFAGYRKRRSRFFLGGMLAALILNNAYLISLVEIEGSVYFVNAIFLVVLIFFSFHRGLKNDTEQ